MDAETFLDSLLRPEAVPTGAASSLAHAHSTTASGLPSAQGSLAASSSDPASSHSGDVSGLAPSPNCLRELLPDEHGCAMHQPLYDFDGLQHFGSPSLGSNPPTTSQAMMPPSSQPLLMPSTSMPQSLEQHSGKAGHEHDAPAGLPLLGSHHLPSLPGSMVDLHCLKDDMLFLDDEHEHGCGMHQPWHDFDLSNYGHSTHAHAAATHQHVVLPHHPPQATLAVSTTHCPSGTLMPPAPTVVPSGFPGVSSAPMAHHPPTAFPPAFHHAAAASIIPSASAPSTGFRFSGSGTSAAVHGAIHAPAAASTAPTSSAVVHMSGLLVPPHIPAVPPSLPLETHAYPPEVLRQVVSQYLHLREESAHNTAAAAAAAAAITSQQPASQPVANHVAHMQRHDLPNELLQELYIKYLAYKKYKQELREQEILRQQQAAAAAGDGNNIVGLLQTLVNLLQQQQQQQAAAPGALSPLPQLIQQLQDTLATVQSAAPAVLPVPGLPGLVAPAAPVVTVDRMAELQALLQQDEPMLKAAMPIGTPALSEPLAQTSANTRHHLPAVRQLSEPALGCNTTTSSSRAAAACSPASAVVDEAMELDDQTMEDVSRQRASKATSAKGASGAVADRTVVKPETSDSTGNKDTSKPKAKPGRPRLSCNGADLKGAAKKAWKSKQQAERARERNRQAQRRFRDRQKNLITELSGELEEANEALRRAIELRASLQQEQQDLQSKLSKFELPVGPEKVPAHQVVLEAAMKASGSTDQDSSRTETMMGSPCWDQCLGVMA